MERNNEQPIQTMDVQRLQSMDRQQPSSSTNDLLTDVEKQILTDWRKMISVCKDRDDCLFGVHPTLLEMNESCKGSGLAAISKCLDLMNVATNYKVKLDVIQVAMATEMIYSKFFYLKETEIMLFFHDYFMYLGSDEFYGSIEPKTIIDMLTKWVREKRGMAISRHEELLAQQRKEEEKPYLMTWEEFCHKNGNNSSNNPKDRILSGFGKRKVPQDTKESITESALAIIENKWGYDNDTMMDARRSFTYRYGYTPEDYLRREGKYV